MGTELIGIRRFKGMTPLLDDALLSDGSGGAGVGASYAEDVDLTAGNIVPVRRDAPYAGTVINPDVSGAAGEPMLFAAPVGRSGDIIFLTRQYDHCAVLTDVSGDTRMYLAGAGVDSKLVRRKPAGQAIIVTSSNPTGAGVPPTPVVTVTPANPSVAATWYAVAAATYVYPDGSEGPLSLYSAEFAYSPGDAFSFAPIPLGVGSPAPTGINFYITVPSAASDVPQVKLLTTTTSPQYPITGILPNDVLGESYPDFDPLPTRMRTVAAAPWGGLAFTTETEPGVLQFTDPMYLNRVYRANDLNVGARVVCVLRGANVLFVLCDDGGPYVVSGTALGNHILTASHKIEVLASGPRGAATLYDTCIFAGSHGLVSVNSSASVATLTEGTYFDWRQWQAMGPSECALVVQSDNSVIFSMPSVQKTGILKPYGLVWRSGGRRVAFARLPSSNSVVFA